MTSTGLTAAGASLAGASLAAGVAFAAAALTAGPVFRLLVRLKSQQTISAHVPEHAAKQGTPTMGGLIVLIGLVAGLLAARPEGWLAPLALVAGFGLVGFVDDFVVPRRMKGKRGLGWMPKLALEIGAAVAAVLLAGGTADPVAIGVTVFAVLFFSNAYNFADGLDGLAGTLGVVMAVGLIPILALAGGSGAGIAAMAALALALVPFLYLNAPPARVFMGDVGALPIGALLGWAVSGLVLDPAGGVMWIWAAPILLWSGVMIAELVPVPLQILSVKLRKGRRLFPRTPIHHAFQHAGWPETRVTAMFVLAQFVLSAAAVILAVLGHIAGGVKG